MADIPVPSLPDGVTTANSRLMSVQSDDSLELVSDIVSDADLATTLDDYVTDAELVVELDGYATDAELAAGLATKYNTTGGVITGLFEIAKTGASVVVNATDGEAYLIFEKEGAPKIQVFTQVDDLSFYTYGSGVTMLRLRATGQVDMSASTSVRVPAPTAAFQAAQVTAIDATTGRIAIGGKEIGDTGWRDVTAAWVDPAALDPGNTGTLKVRRKGEDVLWWVDTLTLAAGTGFLTICSGTVSAGFRAFVSAPNIFARRSNSAATGEWIWTEGSDMSWIGEIDTTTGLGTYTRPPAAIAGIGRGAIAYEAWPTSLPGTPA